MGGGAGVSTRLMYAIAPATFPLGSNVIRMKQKLQANMKFMRHPKVLSNVRMKRLATLGLRKPILHVVSIF